MYNDNEGYYDDYDNNSSNRFLNFLNNNKILLIACMSLFILLLLLILIGNNKNNNPIGKRDIVLKTNEVEINVNGIYIIDPKLININSNSVIYSSNNNDVATVTNTGKITGIGLGKTSISISSSNISKTLNVTVSEGNKDVVLKEINFEGDTLLLPVNYDYKLTYKLEPSDSYIISKSFSSSDVSILTIDNDGNIKTNKEGTSVVKVNFNENISANLNVKVSKSVTSPKFASNLEKIEFTSSEITIRVGNEVSIPFVLTPSDFDSSLINFSVKDSSIASISDYKVKGLKEGNTVLTASYGDVSQVMVINVVNALNLPTSISVKDSSISLKVDDTYQITPTVSPTDSDKTVSYNSTNTNVCNVSNSGLIKGLSKGDCTITIISVSDPTISASISVSVTSESGSTSETPKTCDTDTAIQVTSNTDKAVSTTKSSSKKVFDGSKIEINTDSINDTVCGTIEKIEYCTNKGVYSCDTNTSINKGDVIGINLDKDSNTMFLNIKVTYTNGNSYSKKYYINYNNTGSSSKSCTPNDNFIEITTDPSYKAITSISKGNSNTIISNFKVTVSDKSDGACGSLKKIEYCTSFENNDCIFQNSTTDDYFDVTLPSNKSGTMRLKVKMVYEKSSHTKTYYANYNSTGLTSNYAYNNFKVDNIATSSKSYTYNGGLFNKISNLYPNKFTIKSNGNNFDYIYLCISEANSSSCTLSTNTTNLSKTLTIDGSSINYYVLSRNTNYGYATSNRKSLDLYLASWNTQTVCIVPVSSKDPVDDSILNSKKICNKVKSN